MSIRQKAVDLRAQFVAAGATIIDLPVLLPAETLLDLYGEDIRGRAFVTSDALRGEQMLRPDFTVPVVQKHIETGADSARYTYAGEVFRRQEDFPERPHEYMQVGFEIFSADDPAAADAEVFTRLSEMVAHLGLRASTGDIGILMAAVAGLRTSERRRAALMRHIWRPRRFRALLDRFAGRSEVAPTRQAMIAGDVGTEAPLTGLRSQAEIDARLAIIREDAGEPAISGNEIEGLDTLLAVRETMPFALQQMRDVAVDLPAISPALERFEDRLEALAQRGVDVETLDFEASFGRTSMEYYDGFVFGLQADQRPGLPPVASGGRFDALTKRLSTGHATPAVGGILRPGLMADLEAAA